MTAAPTTTPTATPTKAAPSPTPSAATPESSGTNGREGATLDINTEVAMGGSHGNSEAYSDAEWGLFKSMLPLYKHKAKVNGAEAEYAIDELATLAQKGLGSEEKFKSAAEMRKDAEMKMRHVQDFLSALRENPAAVLEEVIPNFNYRQHAENFLTKEYLKELKPEEYQKIVDQEELQRLRQKEESWKKQQDTSRAQALRDKYVQEYDQRFTKMLESADVPKNEYTVARAAQIMRAALDKGIEVADSDVAELIKEEYENNTKFMLQKVNPDKVLEYLGPDVAKALRQHDLSQIKNPQNAQRKQETAEAHKASKAQKKQLSLKDWKERNAKLIAGLE